MNNKVVLNATVIICLVLINLSCINNTSSELKKRVKEYYKFEQGNDWEKTYSFRTPLFQDSVPQKMYMEGMKKFMQGWTLQKHEIKKVSYGLQNDFAEIEINFSDRHTSKGISIITQMTTWERIDDVWYGRDVGNRDHLPLNSGLVFKRY